MLKKYLCIGLCLLMMFAVGAPAFAQNINSSNLATSYVKFSNVIGGQAFASFPEVGTPVFASTNITNNGTIPTAAVLWVGLYVDNVLRNIEYQRKMIPAGELCNFTTPAIIIPAGSISENTQIIAYIWDSFIGSNAIAQTANMLKDSGELKDITIGGKLLEEFDIAKDRYTAILPKGAEPTIVARAKDNATKVEISGFTVPGTANIKVTKGDGTVTRNYAIVLKASGSITSFEKNKDCPKPTTKFIWGEALIPVSTNAFSDRSWPIVSVSENIVGGTLIRMPIMDVRLTTNETAMSSFMNSNNTYFTFTADTDGTIYALTKYVMDNYTNPNNGWETINNGKNFFPVVYKERTYSAYNKYVDENGVSHTATTDEDKLPYTFNHTNVTSLTRVQDGSAQIYAYVYAKSFKAGDTVAVPTPDNASNGTPTGTADGAVYVINWGELLGSPSLNQSAQNNTEPAVLELN